ncbi:Cellulose binding domain-containing protein [Glycomyces sambucus]|uniref:Cellulose binding domain-containing protein n=1 Tax=Glycomyces sambucus TaxID=380244 RepID=A0A1G9HUM0_9ACTN|nr:cellulose-binding domain-containing protein [Glycomyces sambucus]SDL16414.1 Cellulose binding domain-containing protein [Glycomyces sambucus]
MGPALPKIRGRRLGMVLAGMAAVAIAASLASFAMNPASAQTAGCDVEYRLTAQWPGGYNADVEVTNLGAAAVDPWRLEWDYAGGQKVTNAWNATATQSGAHVTAVGVEYNRRLATGATVSFGFSGTTSGGQNAAPASFKLNGVQCTGAVQPTPTSASPTPTATPTGNPGQDEWNPPANLVQPLGEVWDHVEDTYDLNFRNFGWDQVMATGGTISYCVRWDSQNTVTAQTRDRIAAKLQDQYDRWFDQMAGWNEWPFDRIEVNVVGWAAYDRDLLQWSDDSVDVYIGDIREDAPQCAEECGRFFHQDGNYSQCPGGAARHYDQSLWLTQGMGGGAGGDWGQRMGQEYFVNALDSAQIHIYLHELGHTFGLDDFYDWTPTGQCCFIMKAGSSSTITAFDQWMLRDWWRHLKSRYGY